MDQTIINRLLELNYQFYQTFAGQFSDTRQRLQPGVNHILDTIPHKARILDIGCGNGELWRQLALRGFRGQYVGLDFSSELIEIAKTATSTVSTRSSAVSPPTFQQEDLAHEEWHANLPPGKFDLVLAFAVLHHMPGEGLRLGVLQKVRRLLTGAGRFHHSEWQFLKSPRLRKRIQPWEAIGLVAEDVESGDYLLDWRRGGYGLRYVHHFSEDELEALAHQCGFKIIETFYSDGEGGRLGLYQTWTPDKS